MVKPFRLLLAGLVVATIAVTLALPAGAQERGAYLDGAEPWTAPDCAGDVPIVVGSDARAQSDIYSAVTLAGAIRTDCIVLAGPRNGPMPESQRARLGAASAGGYVVGGLAAVPAEKVTDRTMERIAGTTRWETAQLVGDVARTLTDVVPTAGPTLDTTLVSPGDAQEPGVYLVGAEPWISSDCAGDVPIVVGSDARAQSDIYSAVTLAGVVGTDCIILAGPRDGVMPASQRIRLETAAEGGCIVGGLAALPEAKVGGREMKRIAGPDRWTTAQLVGFEVGSFACANYAHSIRRESTSGDVIVKLHVCSKPELADWFSESRVSVFVDELNKQVAPFYAWQSSGILSVEFQSGVVVASEILASGPVPAYRSRGALIAYPVVPDDCVTQSEDSGSSVHHYLIFSDDFHPFAAGGSAHRCGQRSNTVTHATPASLEDSNVVSSVFSMRTVEHELDHNFCSVHENGILYGLTRQGIGALSLPRTGTWAGYPTAEFRRNENLLYPCYELVENGWPTGEGHPACSNVRLPAPFDRFTLSFPDGTIRLGWNPDSSGHSVNTEPVTGWVVRLRETESNIVVETFNVAPELNSFMLGSHQIGVLDPGIIYVLDVAADSAVGVGDYSAGVDFVYRKGDTDADIGVSRRPNVYPIVFDLSWDPYPMATHYRVVGFENCTLENASASSSGGGWCYGETEEPSFVLHETSGSLIVVGQSYDISVFACGDEVALASGPLQIPPAPAGCIAYGGVTVLAERYQHDNVKPEYEPENLRSISVEVIEGCQFRWPDGTGGLCYRAEWDKLPGEASYSLHAWNCTYAGADLQCTEDYGREYQIVGNRVTAWLKLHYGTEYWIDAYSTLTDFDAHSPSTDSCTPTVVGSNEWALHIFVG